VSRTNSCNRNYVFNVPEKVKNEDLLKKSGRPGLTKNEDFSLLSTRVVTKESDMDEINHDPLIDFFEAPQDPLDNVKVGVPAASTKTTLEGACLQLS